MPEQLIQEHAIQSGRVLRRTDTIEPSQKRHLPENSFWQQTQHIFASAIQKEDYDPDFYIDVSLGENHKQSDEISRFLSMEHGPRLFLLVGPPGVGKTSLVQHYYRSVIKTSEKPWVWIYFNGNEHRTKIENDVAQLTQSLATTCFRFLVKYLEAHGLTREDFLLDVFNNDAALADKAFLYGGSAVPAKIEMALEYLEKGYNIKLASILGYLSRAAPDAVVLVLDNLDPLERRIQVEIVKHALALASSFQIKTLVTARNKTEADLHFNDPNVFSQFIRTPVQPPSLIEVIRKRVSVAARHPDALNAKIGEGALQFRVRECPEFANILVRGLSAEGLQRVIQGVSNDSVRQGLRISLSVYASPYLDPKRIVARLSPVGSAAKDLWHDSIPNHIAVRSILLRTARLYEEEIAWVKNIFGSRASDGATGPFLRLHILRTLRSFVVEEIAKDQIVSDLCNTLDVAAPLVLKELAWLAKHDWIDWPQSNELSLSSLGRFIVDEFVFHRDYLACISTDTDMYPEFERRLIATPITFGENTQNLSVLLEYLALREMEMLQSISRNGGLGPYCRLFGHKGFIPEVIERILANMERLRSEPGIEFARENLRNLLSSREIERICEIIERFGRGRQGHG